MGKKKFLNFAIIGCGSVAIDHAKAIEKLGHKIILGTTKSKNSLNWKIFLKQFPYVKFSSIKKILENKDVDHVVSCLPLDEQKKNCKKFLFSKKSILIEKPLHDNYKKLNKIINNKKSYLNNKAIGYNRRNYEIIEFLKNRINKGGVTSVSVNISENYNILKKKYKSHLNKKFLHVGSSSHIIDLLQYLFVDIKVINKWVFRGKKLNSFSLVMKSKKNFPVFVKINPLDPDEVGIKVRFSDESLWQLAPIERLRIFKGYDIKKLGKKNFNKMYIPRIKSTYTENKHLRPGFVNQIKNFISNNSKKLCRPKQNLKLIRLLNQII